MARTKIQNGEVVPLTPAEETERNAQERDHLDQAPKRRRDALRREGEFLIESELFPWYQRNMALRHSELTQKLAEDETLTPEERAELGDILIKFQWIRDMKDASNLAETSGDDPVWVYPPFDQVQTSGPITPIREKVPEPAEVGGRRGFRGLGRP